MTRSKSYAPLIVAIVLMLAITYIVRPGGEVAAPDRTAEPELVEEIITNMEGVIQDVASDASFFTMALPEGGIEEIVVPEDQVVRLEDVGKIARVSGVRDFATRRISATEIAVTSDASLIVTSPVEDGTVTSPLVVTGFVDSSVLGFNWQILVEEDGFREGFISSGDAEIDGYLPFRLDIFLPVIERGAFTLELSIVGEESIRIPLSLLSDASTSFDVFFVDTASNDCSDVTGVTRTVADTSATGRAALLELLVGPTEEERNSRFVSALPSGLTVESLSISNGQARLELSEELADMRDGCAKEQAIAQLSETIRQFSTIQSARILSGGETIAEID